MEHMVARGSALLKSVDDDYGLKLAEIELFADKLPDEYLRCRELGHNWVPHTATRYRNAIVRSLRCTRCKTRKRHTLDSRGMIQGGTTYSHPEGYLHEGYGQITGEGRGILRITSVLRGRVTEVDDDL